MISFFLFVSRSMSLTPRRTRRPLSARRAPLKRLRASSSVTCSVCSLFFFFFFFLMKPAHTLSCRGSPCATALRSSSPAARGIKGRAGGSPRLRPVGHSCRHVEVGGGGHRVAPRDARFPASPSTPSHPFLDPTPAPTPTGTRWLRLRPTTARRLSSPRARMASAWTASATPRSCRTAPTRALMFCPGPTLPVRTLRTGPWPTAFLRWGRGGANGGLK